MAFADHKVHGTVTGGKGSVAGSATTTTTTSLQQLNISCNKNTEDYYCRIGLRTIVNNCLILHTKVVVLPLWINMF